jgi:alkanesulfonate monooxygenase SsuD/methylene tetrahydromethanopterin reductase-like flavin-dependent oxidoreductase (luciferase family)
VRLGLFIAPQHPAGFPPRQAVAGHLEEVRIAREGGFSSVLVGQHFLAHPYAMLQSVPLLSRLAAEAGPMRLGPGILLLTLLNPLEVAENLATLDALTEGGAIAGFGLGYREVENRAFGVGAGRGRIFAAKLDVVRRLLAGESVTGSGPGYELTDARLSLLPERPLPIWVAANSDAAVERAAVRADAWLVNPHTALGELERQVDLYRAVRSGAGLPSEIGLPILKEVYVAATDDEAWARARPYLEAKYKAYVEWGQDAVLPEGDTLQRKFGELAEGGRFVIGSPETCVEALLEHQWRLGVDEVFCRVGWPGMPHEHVLESLELLSAEVAPRLS